MLSSDSITVSSTWELTPVSIRYSQGEGFNTSLPRITHCTNVLVYSVLVSYIMCTGTFRGTVMCYQGRQ